ncbi:hypothetical protein ALC57_18807, partial [Trachymyrmex cornetzi]
TMTLERALSPLMTIGGFCNLAMFEYPLGQPRTYISCLYGLAKWSLLMYFWYYPCFIDSLRIHKTIYIVDIYSLITIILILISISRFKMEGREALRANLGPLGQKYVEAVLRGAQDKESGIDHVYGVYLHKDGLMFGNKRFDVDDADNIIIDGVRYAGTPGLYELIFKRMPDGALYTEDDTHKYKSMLLMTSAHKHKHHSQGRLLSNRGYKYKYIIAPLMLVTRKKQSKKSGKGLPHAMTLNDNAIDYVHWDDPNELVDRLRLLDASHRAGNNAHDNEMLSIIEELREAGLIIN